MSSLVTQIQLPGGGSAAISVSLGIPTLQVAPPVQVRPQPIEQRRPYLVRHNPYVLPPKRLSPNTSPAEVVYADLAGRQQLIHQTHPSLAWKGLLVPDGGLCASTAACHALRATAMAAGWRNSVFETDPAAAIETLIRAHDRASKRDGRFGMRPFDLERASQEVGNNLDPRFVVNVSRLYGEKDMRATLSAKDAMLLLTVGEGKQSHEIVVVDWYGDQITLSDPNFPNQLISRQVVRDGHGRLSLSGYGPVYCGTMIRVVKGSIGQKLAQDFAEFAGKRVWMTDVDGHRHLETVSKVDAPSPEYPTGRVVAFSSTLGSTIGGSGSLEGVAEMVEVDPPTAARCSELGQYVGQRVRIQFEEEASQRQYGDKIWMVEEITDEVDPDGHPFGGVRVREADKESWQGGRSGIIAFEAIGAVSLDGKV